MQTPNYSSKEYLNAASANAAAAAVSGSLGLAGRSYLTPGLISPESAVISTTGLVAGVSLPAPFAVLFPDGVLAGAHGTQTGADTQSYTFNFASLVPASGSVTAYLTVSEIQIQQQPYQVIGPPPGNPDYDPTFVPYTAYAVTVDSVAVSGATSFGANSFELAHTTLAAGATGMTFDVGGQVRASAGFFRPPVVVSVNSNISLGTAGRLLVVNGASTQTLPSALNANGAIFVIDSQANNVTIATAAPDLIYGYGASPGVGINSFNLPNGESVTLISIFSLWQILSSSPGLSYGSAAFKAATNTADAKVVSLDSFTAGNLMKFSSVGSAVDTGLSATSPPIAWCSFHDSGAGPVIDVSQGISSLTGSAGNYTFTLTQAVTTAAAFFGAGNDGSNNYMVGAGRINAGGTTGGLKTLTNFNFLPAAPGNGFGFQVFGK